MVLLLETWLKDDEQLNIDGYCWYGNNRSFMHKNAFRNSGGVGFLVKRTLIDCHDVDVIENKADGIIALGISNKESQFSTLIIGLYIPPENSVIGEKN